MIPATTKRCCLIIFFFQSTSPIVNIPIFELTVQLLYSHQPDDLVHFVTFVHQAREAQLTSDSTFSRQCKKVSKYQALKILPYASLQPFLSLSLFPSVLRVISIKEHQMSLLLQLIQHPLIKCLLIVSSYSQGNLHIIE